MLNSARHTAIGAYAAVGLETGVAAAQPHRLIEMLFEGALEAMAQAKLAIGKGDVAAKGHAISRAIKIIEEGLKVSLDDRGGQLCSQLRCLYDYISQQLLLASLRNNAQMIDDASALLGDIKQAWTAINPNAGAG